MTGPAPNRVLGSANTGSNCYFCGRTGRAEEACSSCMIAMPALTCACGARSSPLASACTSCHAPLREPEFPAMACPACTVAKRASGPLVRLSRGELTLHGCNTCRGVFVPARAWCMLLARPTEVPALPPALPKSAAGGAVLELVACPLCHKPAERGRFAGRSQVVVDLCDRHGIWLDAGELADILAFTVADRSNVDGAHARLAESMRGGDAFAHATHLDIERQSAPKGSSGKGGLGLVLVAAALLLGSVGAGAAWRYLVPHHDNVTRAGAGAQKALGH